MSSPIALFLASGLIQLSCLDLVIISIYFLAVLGMGFLLRGQVSTGNDFFLAGREMTRADTIEDIP